VDAKAWKLDDYYDIVKKPMDLSIVKNKLADSEYNTLQEFSDDVNLVFNNCLLYNGDQNE
jgi:hypothetical protein